MSSEWARNSPWRHKDASAVPDAGLASVRQRCASKGTYEQLVVSLCSWRVAVTQRPNRQAATTPTSRSVSP
jgi:hypothetical protein